MDIKNLIELMAKLRDPVGGCPWDQKQTFATIAPYTIEEAYEVAEAIDHQDMQELKIELGDLLFQVVFHARMAEEARLFDFSDVVEAIVEKMIRRHPHVFAAKRYQNEKEFRQDWEAHKQAERVAKGREKKHHLDDISQILPALKRAQKIQKRVATAGFDWSTIEPVFEKVHEEIEEIHQALQENEEHERIQEEVGDLLFSVVNLSRHLKVDAEEALRKANNKFCRRYALMENQLVEAGKQVESATEKELLEFWESSKRIDQ